MTNLERLIQAHVEATTTTTLSRATEELTEEFARETMRDPAVKAEIRELVRKHFGHTMEQLRQNGTKPAKRNARRK